MRNSTTHPRGLRAALIAGGLALVLTTAACGSDAGTGASGASAPATSAPATSATSATESSPAETSSMESTGMESTGMESTGMESTGMESTGMESTGTESTGTESTGTESSSTESSGMESSSGGSSSSGSESSSGATSASVAMTGPAPTALTDAEKTAAKGSLVDPSSLTVCTSLPYPPFEGDDGTGKVTGFDIDFMDWIAEQLGVTTKVVSIDFSGIKSGQAMASKNCDIAAAAMTINAERQAVIEFSDPYYDASQALMVLKDSPVTDLSGLSGKKLGAQTGTTGLEYANANAAEFGYSVVEYQNISDEEQALQTNAVDAAIHDQPALNDYVKQQAGAVTIVKNFNTGEQYGFGAAKGNTALIAVANFVIKQSQSDGKYEASFKKWIDSSAG